VCLHMNWKAPVATDLYFIVKGEVFLKVTGIHMHCKSGTISETVLYRDVVVILVYGLSDNSNYDDLECR